MDESSNSTLWLFEDIEEGFLEPALENSPLDPLPPRDDEPIQDTEAKRINPDKSQTPSSLISRNATNDVHLNQTFESNKRNRKIIPFFLLAALMTLPHLSFSFEVLPLYYNSIIILMMIIILSRLILSGVNRGKVVQPEEQEFYTGIFLYAGLCMYFSWKVIEIGFVLTLFLGFGFQSEVKDKDGIFKNASPMALDFLSLKSLHPLCMMLQAACVLAFFL